MTRGAHQDEFHGVKLALEGIENQAEAFEGGGAEEGLVAFFAEDDRGRAALATEFEIGITDSACDDGAVGEREFELLVRVDTERAEPLARHQAIDSAGIDEKIDCNRLAAVA